MNDSFLQNYAPEENENLSKTICLIRVASESLSEIFTQNPTAHFILKIDVEGAEYEIMRDIAKHFPQAFERIDCILGDTHCGFLQWLEILRPFDYEVLSAKPTDNGCCEFIMVHKRAIKTAYKIFGVLIFCKTTTIIKKTRLIIRADIGSDDWMNIGKYIAKNPNIEQEILALIKGLDKANKNFILRQIALSLEAYKNNDSAVTKLTQKEITDIIKEREEFWSNLFKISDNLYAYDGYLLPTNEITAEAFFYKYGLDILEPQTLAKMQQKDFIDVGGYVGDSAIMFEREFCDKNIYSFEATQTNFRLMERTLELHNSKRIIPINKGLGAEKGTLQINIFGDCSGFYKSFGGKTENAEVITLDEFVRQNKIEVGFIKTDIEGFEMEF